MQAKPPSHARQRRTRLARTAGHGRKNQNVALFWRAGPWHCEFDPMDAPLSVRVYRDNALVIEEPTENADTARLRSGALRLIVSGVRSV